MAKRRPEKQSLTDAFYDSVLEEIKKKKKKIKQKYPCTGTLFLPR